MIQITEEIALHEWEILEEFVRSSGPGGQNVNKVETAVQLRFDVAHSPSLPNDVRARLRALAGKRLTEDGVLVIIARATRSQAENREQAYARLVDLIQRAAIPPVERRATKPTYGSKLRRLEGKTRRGAIKQQRQKGNFDDLS